MSDASLGPLLRPFPPERTWLLPALQAVQATRGWLSSDDLAAVGRGYGFEAVTVRAPADLGGVADWVAGPRRAPLLVHAPIASDGGSWWLAEAFRGH